jgi:AAA15 family ATPase/GTPase
MSKTNIMTALEYLSITNFRGFDALEIDGLSKLNLFVGKNNSGKTSILESIFLLIGMSNPLLPTVINQIRGLNTGNAKQLAYLFHGLKMENKPSFSAKFADNSDRILRFEPKYKQNESFINASSSSTLELIGLDLNFQELKENKQNLNRRSTLVFGSNVINQIAADDYEEELHAVFIADKNDAATLSRFSEMMKHKRTDFILRALQKFDDNIQDIKTLPDGIYFDVKGVKELVPTNIMGDGIRRFLNIVTAVYEKENSFVCIDEIENGLHYSAYKLLWKSLLSFLSINDVQLFITTHNIETLTCLKSVLEEDEFKNMRGFSKVFAVSKTEKSEFKTYRYSFEEFKTAIDNDIELRR